MGACVARDAEVFGLACRSHLTEVNCRIVVRGVVPLAAGSVAGMDSYYGKTAGSTHAEKSSASADRRKNASVGYRRVSVQNARLGSGNSDMVGSGSVVCVDSERGVMLEVASAVDMEAGLRVARERLRSILLLPS